MNIDLHTIIEQVKITPDIHDRLKSKIIEEIVKFLISNPKYTIVHSRDPPWDHSGELLKVGDHFLPNLYATVGDFLGEYSGAKTPSFASGYGWFYPSIEDELCNGEFASGNVYADYFIEILKQKHGLDEDDADEAFSAIQDYLGDQIFELNEEIKSMSIFDLYHDPFVDELFQQQDDNPLQADILELIHRCDENSEVMLFIYEKTSCVMIENKYTLDMCHLRRDSENGNDPDSDFLNWQYLMNAMIAKQSQTTVITVKTPILNGKTEIRVMRIEDGMIEPLSAEEVRLCYSTCADCGAYQKPPDDYVFCDFNS